MPRQLATSVSFVSDFSVGSCDNYAQVCIMLIPAVLATFLGWVGVWGAGLRLLRSSYRPRLCRGGPSAADRTVESK